MRIVPYLDNFKWYIKEQAFYVKLKHNKWKVMLLPRYLSYSFIWKNTQFLTSVAHLTIEAVLIVWIIASGSIKIMPQGPIFTRLLSIQIQLMFKSWLLLFFYDLSIHFLAGRAFLFSWDLLCLFSDKAWHLDIFGASHKTEINNYMIENIFNGKVYISSKLKHYLKSSIFLWFFMNIESLFPDRAKF